MSKRIGMILILSGAMMTGCGPSEKSTFNAAEHAQDFEEGFFTPDEALTEADRKGGEGDTQVLNPEEEKEYKATIKRDEGLFKSLLSFPQTEWNECADKTTGNYLEYACAKSRDVSVILDGYLQDRLLTCVDAAMVKQGGGKAARLHLVHAGVTADVRHSPKSLHSYNRAIDIKAIKVDLKTGGTRDYTYSKIGNRPFYTELRNCWGKLLKATNGCPLYNGNAQLTGSIGWENADHGRHMHLSVPYCLSGKYGAGLWVR